MATEEWIQKAIENERLYDELPPRVRQLLTVAEWKTKVKTFYHQKGSRWERLAVTACGEQEYYEDLIRYFRQSMRVFPYHLSDFVCQVLRIAPFKYYCDLLFATMRDELSYDRIPNFTAADIVRVVGIGRNEFISIMNQCKAKKVLWRINKSVAKDFLPVAPLDIPIQPWWIAHVVNFTAAECEVLMPQELKVCRSIVAAGGMSAAQLPDDIMLSLYRRGLLYLEVPILATDYVTIPPLEGFVSNKDMEVGKEKGDPVERLLYLLFVATTDRADVAALAAVLSVELEKLQEAVSIACRLGFGTKTTAGSNTAVVSPRSTEAAATSPLLDIPEDGFAPESGGRAGDGLPLPPSTSTIAVVVDAQVTSFLMMGAMSPGLKRHSVSLFEGGRVTGHDVIADMIHELHLSVEAGRGFEGEMQQLSVYCRSLAMALDTVTAVGGGAAVELLRKESLTSLAPLAAARVLAHSYTAVLPIAPLPFPPLPLSPLLPGPVNFGSTLEASTPWLHLLLYTTLQQGPPSLVMPAGQRLWRLPPPLQDATHALVWPWSPVAVRAEAVPLLLPAAFLLLQLNEALTQSALLIQPLHLHNEELCTVDVPLPMAHDVGAAIVGVSRGGEEVRLPPPPRLAKGLQQLGLSHAPGFLRFLQVKKYDRHAHPMTSPSSSAAAAHAALEDTSCNNNSGSSSSRSSSVTPAASKEAELSACFDSLADSSRQPVNSASPAEARPNTASLSQPVSETEAAPAVNEGTWVPLQLSLGMPLIPQALNQMVCERALAVDFLKEEGLQRHQQGQQALQQQLLAHIAEFGTCEEVSVGIDQDEAATSTVDLPLHNLLFDGRRIWQAELTSCLQGVGMLCLD